MSQPPDNDHAGARASLKDVLRRMELIRSFLARRLSAEQQAWLAEQVQRIGEGGNAAALATAIGLAPRRLGKAELALGEAERAAAQSLVPGLDTSGWSVDQAARVLFVLAAFDGDALRFAERLEQLLRSGEIGEHIALLRGLPLYPDPGRLVPLAGEGIRSAMQPVFEAVAHNSPYPARHFPEAMWNQMVVKALFIGSRLAPIQGLEERRNAELARMLVDYAHERWAARRSVSPELWRCVGPYASEDYFADLLKVFRSGGGVERKAAALALAECPAPEALIALETAPTLWRDIRSGRLTWEQIGGEIE
jgi:hypothetical protein